MKLIDSLKAIRRTSTPLVGIESPDPGATIQVIRAAFEEGTTPLPLFRWDISNGLSPMNKSGLEIMRKLLSGTEPNEWPGMTSNPGQCLVLLQNLPGEDNEGDKVTCRAPMVFFLNPQLFVSGDKPDEPTIQGIWNLRDLFKQDRRTLIMLGTSLRMPPELSQDVIILKEPLPADDQLGEIIAAQMEGFGLKLTDNVKAQAIDATRGLSAFVAEQATAMSIGDEGIILGDLWERKRTAIEQTRGLSVDRGSEDFASIGGQSQIKKFGTLLLKSPRRPRLFVRIDELEKMLGGAGTRGAGDNTGVSQDRLGTILREMEDNDWTGLLAVGPAGSGKSLLSKALGNSSDPQVMSIAMDLGAMSSGRVGASETLIRDAMRTIKGVAGPGGAFFIATVNKLDVLPPELRRRFRMGIWFFDLPDADELASIWEINLAKYSLAKSTRGKDMIDDTNLTGADIRNLCDIASRLGCSLKEAFQYITPIAVSDPDSIDNLRRTADGRFLSASKPGPYRMGDPLVKVTTNISATAAPRRARFGEER